DSPYGDEAGELERDRGGERGAAGCGGDEREEVLGVDRVDHRGERGGKEGQDEPLCAPLCGEHRHPCLEPLPLPNGLGHPVEEVREVASEPAAEVEGDDG